LSAFKLLRLFLPWRSSNLFLSTQSIINKNLFVI
jgi:hypothetical protein